MSQPCNVVYTEFRPTPLQHYIFPAGGDGIYLVVDEKGAFRVWISYNCHIYNTMYSKKEFFTFRFQEDNFQKALAVLNSDTPDTGLYYVSHIMVYLIYASFHIFSETDKKKKKTKKTQKGPPDIYKILRMIMERNYNPVIVFRSDIQ